MLTVPVPLRQKVAVPAVPETLERSELPEREEEKTEVSPDFQPETVWPLLYGTVLMNGTT
jgi:hypothetical protein